MSAAQAATLQVMNTALQGREFALEGGNIVIGRAPDCQIQIDQNSVSRAHVRIVQQGGRFLAQDLGSRNGMKINGIEMSEAELRSGDVLHVGEVQLRFRCDAAPDAGPQTALPENAESVRPLTGSDIVAAAQQTAPPAAYEAAREEPTTGAAVGVNLKLVFAIMAGLLVAVGASALVVALVVGGGGRADIPSPGVMVQVGGQQWYGYSQAAYGDFNEENLIVENPEIADARRFGPGELVVLGKTGGATTIHIRTQRGVTIPLRVIVRGVAKDELEELREARMMPQERRRSALQFIRNGQLIEKEQPYLAMKEYEKALAVLEPLPEKGTAFLHASRLYDDVKERVDERWKTIEGEARLAAQNSEFTRLVDLLDRAIDLIPDPADPRHQKAQVTRWQAINALEEAEKRTAK